MTARPLQKQKDTSLLSRALRDERVLTAVLKSRLRVLEDKLQAETKLRVAAELNATRFHALMLQARVREIAKGNQ